MTTLIERVTQILETHPALDGKDKQKKLAVAAGASKSVVNQWLSGGIKSMHLKFALNIERNLGYNHIWLVLGEGEQRNGEISGVSPQAIEVARAFDRITDPEQKASILTQLKAFGVLRQPASLPVAANRPAVSSNGQKESSGSF